MQFLDTHIENAWRYCIQELSQIIKFRCVLQVDLLELPSVTEMPIRFIWIDEALVEPWLAGLKQAIWLKGMHCSQCQVFASPRLPSLEFQQHLDWSVQNLVLMPLHSLAGKALGGLLLLHDQEVLNQQEFLHLAEPLRCYAALLLEFSQFKRQQWLPLNTLSSELNALQTDSIFAKKQAMSLQRLQTSLTQLTDQTAPVPCVQTTQFSLRQLLERFITEQTPNLKTALVLHFNTEIPLSLEGDARIVRQLVFNLCQQAFDYYPNEPAFNLYVLMLENNYPEVLLKLSISPASHTALRGKTESNGWSSLLQRAEATACLCQAVQGKSYLLPNSGQNTLWFSLRLKRSAWVSSYNVQQTAALLDESNEPAQALKTFRILVAEDSPINQTVIHKMLNRLGYPCQLVDNGLKVLEAWRAGDYQLILMDCEMPELDGYDAAAKIRKCEQSQGGHIPIIALTAHALAEHRERSRAVGMDEHLSKPISLPVLKETLEYWEQQSSKLQIPTAAKMPSDNSSLASSTPSAPRTAKTVHSLGEIIDDKTLTDLKKVLGNKFFNILQQFLSYAPQQLEHLQVACAQQDYEGMRSKAHQLKGEAAQIGAEELSHLCLELEMLARLGNITAAKPLLKRIDVAVQQVIERLQQELNKA